jgi:hypothetical protein
MPRGYSRPEGAVPRCLVTTDFIYLYLFEPIFYLLASLIPYLIFSPHNFNHLLRPRPKPKPKPKTYQQSRQYDTIIYYLLYIILIRLTDSNTITIAIGIIIIT